MTAIIELQRVAGSWLRCRECSRLCKGPLGLHRHIRAAHGQSAWEYYQRYPDALLLRALDTSTVTELELAVAIGPCWLHRGAPDRWGARLRVAGAPTSALYRLTYWVVHGQLPKGYACHACDVPQCVNPLHVWDGSAQDNARDRDRKGRAHDRRKLSKDQAAWMRRLHHSGSSFRDLGRRFGVSPETARRAVRAVIDREQDAVAAAFEGDVPW